MLAVGSAVVRVRGGASLYLWLLLAKADESVADGGREGERLKFFLGLLGQ